jgi:hypothetical protein
VTLELQRQGMEMADFPELVQLTSIIGRMLAQASPRVQPEFPKHAEYIVEYSQIFAHLSGRLSAGAIVIRDPIASSLESHFRVEIPKVRGLVRNREWPGLAAQAYAMLDAPDVAELLNAAGPPPEWTAEMGLPGNNPWKPRKPIIVID